jgi:hypothetical protein
MPSELNFDQKQPLPVTAGAISDYGDVVNHTVDMD